MDSNVLVAIIVVAASLGVAAFGFLMDNSAAKKTRQELLDIQARDKDRDVSIRALQRDMENLQKQVVAWRHWVNKLIPWGSNSTEQPPRTPPEPPSSLMDEDES